MFLAFHDNNTHVDDRFNAGDVVNNFELIALRVLWDFHTLEKEKFSATPQSHPLFQSKFQQYKSAQRTSISRCNHNDAFLNIWKDKLTEIHGDVWTNRSRKCLTMFRKMNAYCNPSCLFRGTKAKGSLLPYSNETHRICIILRELAEARNGIKASLSQFLKIEPTHHSGTKFLRDIKRYRDEIYYMSRGEHRTLFPPDDPHYIGKKDCVDVVAAMTVLSHLSKAFDHRQGGHIALLLRRAIVVQSKQGNMFSFFSLSDINYLKCIFSRLQQLIDDPEIRHDKEKARISEAHTRLEGLLFRVCDLDDSLYGLWLKCTSDFVDFRIVLKAVQHELDQPDRGVPPALCDALCVIGVSVAVRTALCKDQSLL